MSKNPNSRVLTVIDSQQLTPNMQRISFQADELSDFPSDAAGGYIKLLFTEQGNTDISQLTADERPKMRTYTIRHLRQALNQLDVDFVRHEHLSIIDNNSDDNSKGCNSSIGGFAAAWSQSVSIGDTISIAGPGMIKPVNINTDWYFLVADMTALPALSAQLTKLPTAASGYAVIEINHQDDKQTLVKPEGIEIIWVVADDAKTNLLTQVKALTWQQGEVSVWCACEFSAMRALRVYFRNDKSVDKDNLYISSYWKSGCTEDGHKIAKRDDNLAEDSLAKKRVQ
ncbi:siderophore-interacting protein [Moritella viscosa]|uniref:Vulnibactin utilization protein ViuB n=1 Tax=Moritella viscosa TaxID=80854 RepID=A0ABY1HDJ9_9GAMM|nr:siderophore-interacting protein [Moritella viscosa]CED59416.1 siderophore utilization protein ViuB [Moritella viscosa]SGY86228.1 Vulnibactin utilization protein ViuB [Moritella viscosa]SGY87592.1 Vulnibactin utilization protein ViuB [Moritella viscosa]SGY89722.1 Vulnibactin utilization protein ViuB [Moritella viscosa]SHO01489.1 Vulnibactin utilization protein ViuB [Moritella viscosa]